MRQTCIDLPHMYSCSVTAYLMTASSNRQTISDDLILLTSMQVPFRRLSDYHSLFFLGLSSEMPSQYLQLNNQRSFAATGGGLMYCVHSYFRVV